MEILPGSLDIFVKFAQEHKICLIISNCDRNIKNELKKINHDLKRIEKEKKNVRVNILTQENEINGIGIEDKV